MTTEKPAAPLLPPFVASRLNALRERRKLTRRQLAQLAGLSDGTVRRVLEGHDAKLSTLTAIADVLQTDVATLLRADAA